MSGPLCVAAEGNCGIDAAPTDSLGMFHVRPEGDTACLDGSPYSFQVRRGDPRKLHMHIQGGGACRDQASYAMGLCTRRIEHEWQGVFNYTDSANPFQNYSVLVVNYCSGDLHNKHEDVVWGDTTRKVRGYNNVMTAITYALANFRDLDTLTFSGTSAGSLGMHLWAGPLIKTFSGLTKETTVVLDGWLDLPAHPSHKYPEAGSTCSLDILDVADKEECVQGKFTLWGQLEKAVAAHPNVRFAAIDAAVDHYQVRVFGVGSEEFYKYMTVRLNEDLRFPNFYTYLVRGSQHVFFTRPTFSITTPDSVDGSGTEDPPLRKWLADFIVAPPQQRVVCLGAQEKRRVTTETDVTGWGHDYCGLRDAA